MFISKNKIILGFLLIGLLGTAFIVREIQKTKGINPPDSLSVRTVEAREQTADEISNSRHNAITRAVERVSSAVVGINVIQVKEYVQRSPFSSDPFFRQFFPDYVLQRPVKSLGSGFIISSDGYLLTNDHVTEDAREIVVTLTDGKKYDAKLVGRDNLTDIALLKIDGENFSFIPMGNSDDSIVGEWVIALGNPFGLFEVNDKPTVTVGVVSAVTRDFGRQINNRVYQGMIQTDAAINRGNSGGPLVNSLGEVIGINTFIFTGSEYSEGSIGLGFAIPINTVKSIVADLRENGKVDRNYWVGLEIQDLTKFIALNSGYSSTEGVVVSKIQPKSPAEKAGFKLGDIVYEFNGKHIFDSNDITQALNNSAPKVGDTFPFKIFRQGEKLTINLKLEKRK